MKNCDFEFWKKEHKDINNNLAVPLYRSFCKAYGINFHFPDEIKDNDPKIKFEILNSEMPLHGKALSLFNFVNKPYHPFREGLVSFAYTSWDDFHYEKLTLEEVARKLENKDIELKRSEAQSTFYTIVAFISTSLLVFLIATRITNTLTLPVLALIISVALLITVPQAVHRLRERTEQEKFNKKLYKLKQELQEISILHKAENSNV